MQFLYPYFLGALAVIAVPIIIHLFYFRRFKKVYFTNVRFLKDVKEETAARSKLRNLLVLLARIFALACLVLAFCMPYLHREDARIGRKASGIFIDNSFSMEAKAADVILLEKARAYAREVVASQNEDDLIQILTHDFEGRHQRLVDKQEALNLIEDITISPSVRLFSQIEARQKQLLNTENVEYRNLYWISDFQKSITDIDTLTDTSYQYYVMPLQSVEESNISIDSAWLVSPVARLNEPNTVFVKLTNRGNATAENVRLSVLHEGQEKPIAVVDLDAGVTMTDTFNFSISEPGWQHIEIKLTDHPVTFDDQYFMAFEVAEKVRILTLHENQPDRFLRDAQQSMEMVDASFQSVRQVDYSVLANTDMVILDELTSVSTGLTNELKSFVENGGNLLVFPSDNVDVSNFNQFLSSFQMNRIQGKKEEEREVSNINTDEFIFSDVFARINRNVRLPSTSFSYSFDRSGRREETLLRYRDGESFMSKYIVGDGRIYLCAAPINESHNSLVKDAEIFVPMLYKMGLSTSEDVKMAYTIGVNDIIEVRGQWDLEDRVLEVKGNTNFIPGINRIGNQTVISINNQIQEDGVYDLMAGDQLVQKLAFNYDRTESRLEYFQPEELKSKWKDQVQIVESDNQTQLAQVLKESEEGQPLWKWLLIFTLIFLAIEQLLLRLWKI